MIGFTFRNIHSSVYKIGVRSSDRTVIPELRKNEFVIPGRHGTIDYGLNTYEKRSISVKITTVENTTWEELRASARNIAQWLSGKGMLIFDDEPDKAYQASVYSSVGIEQIQCLPGGFFEVVFECQPFAESLNYNQVYEAENTSNSFELLVNVAGTSETPCIITIKNNDISEVNNITLTRKAEI